MTFKFEKKKKKEKKKSFNMDTYYHHPIGSWGNLQLNQLKQLRERERERESHKPFFLVEGYWVGAKLNTVEDVPETTGARES